MECAVIKVFTTKNFARWAKKEKIDNKALKHAVDEIIDGQVEANLGGGLFKKRIARKGYGKRGGYRVLLAFKKQDRTLFIFGFSKKDRDNIDDDEKLIYKKLCEHYLTLSLDQLATLCNEGKLKEVHYEKT